MSRWILGLAVLAACLLPPGGSGGTAIAATQMSIAFTNAGTPVAGAEIALFFSNDVVTAVSDKNGVAQFSIDRGKGFWVEVNGQRLAKFYSIDQPPASIDMASVGTMVWRGRR